MVVSFTERYLVVDIDEWIRERLNYSQSPTHGIVPGLKMSGLALRRRALPTGIARAHLVNTRA